MTAIDFARTTARRSREDYRLWRLRRLVAAMAETLESNDAPPPDLFRTLVRTWANQWSVNADFLDTMFGLLRRSSGSVVECGCGATTLALVAGLSFTTRRMLSLEDDAVWANRVRRALPASIKTDFDIIVRPLVSHGSYDWYDVARSTLPESIGFVVCDGPAGSTRGGRYGVIPMVKGRLLPDAIVLLDDTRRPQERKILERWCSELPARLIDDGPRYSAIQIVGGSKSR